MKKFFLTVLTWLFGWPIITAFASFVFPDTITQIDGKDVVTPSGASMFIGFIGAIYLTFLIFRKKRSSIKNSNLANSEISENYSDDINSPNLSSSFIIEKKKSLKGFEKLFGPYPSTKDAWHKEEQDALIEEEKGILRSLVSNHMDALKNNWISTVTEDEYGTRDYQNWVGQLDRFFNSVNYRPEKLSREEALKIATYEVEASNVEVSIQKESSVEEKADQMILMGLVEKHKNALVRNWHKNVEQDDYGSKNLHLWHEEVGKFLSSVSFLPKAMSLDLAAVIVTAMVEDIVAGDEVKSVFDFQEITSAYDFEEKCAEELSRVGWSTRVTSGSGDQGIDVLAEKRSVRVVIQCKLYNKPVGNKAVQEAISGKAYEKADYAAVVAPNGFTKSAKELAQRDGVFLLSPKDLKALDRYIET